MDNLNLSSLASLTSESLILKQLFTLWDQSFSCKEGYVSFGKSIVLGTAKALGIFLIQYLVKNPDKILAFFRSLALKFIYRRLELKPVSGTKAFYMNKLLQKEINPKMEPSSSLTISGLPLYLTLNGSYTVLEYCPGIHQKFVTDIDQEATLESEVQQVSNKVIKTQCRDMARKVFVPDTLFPSKNYILLDKIITNFFTVVNRTKMYKAQGILIDGEPGLGKSKSCDYLASLNKYHEIYYVNLSLTSLLKKDFKSIIDEVLNKRNGSTIIYFDELDKYLDYYIEYSFYKQEEIQDFIEYKRRLKQEFLYELLEVIETTIYEDGVVFIFCSNNFHTIFEDTTASLEVGKPSFNQVHFHSLKSRFAPIRFNRCDREEIIKFITFFNDKMYDTEMYYEKSVLNGLIQNIKNPISLTYRSLRHCHIKAGYDLEKFIEFINEYEPEMSPKMDEIKVVKKISMKRLVDEDKKEVKKEEIKKKEIKKEEIKKEEIKKEGKDLWMHAKEGNLAEMKEILATGVDIDSIDGNGCTALILASQNGKLECIQELIRLGADVNFQNCDGSTSLMLATRHLECIQELIRSSADINLQNNCGDPAFIYAVQNGKLECLQELIRSGADINHQNKKGYTAVMFASQNEKLECLQELIRLGADVNLQHQDGSTALIWASQNRKVECVQELLGSGADVNWKNKDGSTALEIASIREHPSVVKLLLDAGAHPILPSGKWINGEIHNLIKSYQKNE
jgi:ankyrin repeat protein